MNSTKKAIALEGRLRDCKNVITLGVRPNFSDYDRREMTLIRNAKKIYYPSAFYADMFDAMGKPTFPGYHNYKCVQDKIKQTAMFELLEIPHPRTRVYYGKRQKQKHHRRLCVSLCCQNTPGLSDGSRGLPDSAK